jgi:hypothetical protein
MPTPTLLFEAILIAVPEELAEVIPSTPPAGKFVRLEPSPSLFSRVPVPSGRVIVLSVFVAGDVTVNTPVPEALLCTLILLIICTRLSR